MHLCFFSLIFSTAFTIGKSSCSALDRHAIMPRMRRKLLSIVLLCGLLMVGGSAQAQADDLLGRINALRASLGLPGYTLNGQLSAAAQSHAQWMTSTQQVSHTQPNGSTPSTRAAAAGYPGRWVSENIYGGTGANANAAWGFWVNSPLHYRGLTNASYQEIGIGVASTEGWTSIVLVFGSQTGATVSVPRSGSSGGGAAQASGPPPYVVGQDNFGNIMHEIQQGHTVGDIALIYGYTWDDIPEMLELNNLTQDDFRVLPVGGIFLVPPHDGTFTPTPGTPTAEPTATPTVDQTVRARINELLTPQPTREEPEATPTVPGLSGDGPRRVVTAAAVPAAVATQPDGDDSSTADLSPTVTPESTTVTDTTSTTPTTTPTTTQEAVQVAAVPTLGGSQVTTTGQTLIVRENNSPWLIAAVILQSLIIGVAGLEMIRRMRRK
jgi:uncharacterized protein YkwD